MDFVIERKDKQKKKDLSYGQEIPLKKTPIDFLYDTKEEQQTSDPNVGNINIMQLEDRRNEEEELRKRKKDIEKLNQFRRQNFQEKEVKDRSDLIKVNPLLLPPSTVTEASLQEVVSLRKKSLKQCSIPPLSNGEKRITNSLAND